MELIKLLILAGYLFNFPIGAMFYITFNKKWHEIFLSLIPFAPLFYYWKDLE